jgi:hypothetical protein
VSRAISDPATVLKELGEPQRSELKTLYRSDDLTILNVIWAPWMTLLPHNHQMWAVIGIYTGREDNIFWRRVGKDGHKIEAAGARALSVKDAEPLGRDIIHSVTNPIPRLTCAIHVYGGEIFSVPAGANGTPKCCSSSPAIPPTSLASSRTPTRRLPCVRSADGRRSTLRNLRWVHAGEGLQEVRDADRRNPIMPSDFKIQPGT